MARTLLIVNPDAGQGRRQAALDAALAERPWIEVHRSTSAEDAAEAARRAVRGGVDVLAAGGGDGTVHDVVGAVAHQPPPALGVVPLGTANDLAKTLGLPLDDPGAALDLLRDGAPREIDLGRITDSEGQRWMVNAASAGFTEEVEAALDAEIKARWKALAYLRATLEVMPSLTRSALTIEVDGAVHTVDACALMVANGRYAGGVHFAPETDPGDRMLDVLAVTTAEVTEQLGLGVDWALGRHLDSPHVWAARGRRIRIDGVPARRFRVDGEAGGSTPARFEVVPGALTMLGAPQTVSGRSRPGAGADTVGSGAARR